MKKYFILILCILYTFVTFGGSIFIHNCGDDTQLSMYEKFSHHECPICAKNHPKNHREKKQCNQGDCKDVEIKIDQLSEQVFSPQKTDAFFFTPIILTRFWIDIKPTSSHIMVFHNRSLKETNAGNSSPPVYILHRNLRN